MKTVLKKGALFAFATIFVLACVATDPNYETAKLSFKNGDYEKALESVNIAVTNNPGNPDYLKFKADVLSNLAKKQSAPSDKKEYLEEMVSSYKTAKAIYDTTGKKGQGDFIELALTNEWANAFNAGVKLIQGVDSPAPEVLEKSQGHLQNAIMINPDSVNTYEILAEVYYMDENLDGAIEYLSKSIEISETPPMNSYLRLAGFYEAKGNSDDQIIEVLSAAQQAYPDNIDVVQSLANVYLRSNQTEKALAAVKTLIEREPDNPQYRLVYGTQIYSTTDLLGTELDANFEAISVLRKEKSAASGKQAKAMKQVEIDSLTTRNGELTSRIEELTAEALDQLTKVVELRPDDAQANFTIGVILQNKAATLFKERDNTDDNDLAKKLDDEAKAVLKEALPYYEKSVEIKPDDQEYWMTLFRVYTTLGMTEKAQVAMEKAGI